MAALLHDLGKGQPGDHSETGAALARAMVTRMGFAEQDVDVITTLVRHHLLLPEAATRRDLDDPATIAAVATEVGTREVLDLLAALTEADAIAAGPLAWTPWRQALIGDLVGRVRAVLGGAQVPQPAGLEPWQRDLASAGQLAVEITDDGTMVTVVAPDRTGLLATVAGVLALHRLDVRSAAIHTQGATAVQVLRVESSYAGPPPREVLRDDVKHALQGTLDVEARLLSRVHAWQPPAVPVPAAQVAVVPGASADAVVVEVRAHDVPGLLYRLAGALASCDVAVRSAVVGTLGAEAVDVLYLVAGGGGPLDEATTQKAVEALRAVLAELAPG